MTRSITDLLALREGITPGEWVVKNKGRYVRALDDNKDVARVFSNFCGPEEREANARAIAALPELFDAMERMRDDNMRLRRALVKITDIQNQEYGPDYEEIDEARSIARAALANRSEG